MNIQKTSQESPSPNSLQSIDLSQLKSPTTPQDFLKLLRLISENLLLMDPDFQNNEFLVNIFDAQKIYDPTEDYLKLKFLGNKSTVSNDHSVFESYFKIKGIDFSFAKYIDHVPVKSVSSMSFITSSKDNPFTAELVMHELGANDNWRDPLNKFNVIGIPENMDFYRRRTPVTHANGYFQTEYIHQNSRFISRLDVELNYNGSLRSIMVDQKDK